MEEFRRERRATGEGGRNVAKGNERRRKGRRKTDPRTLIMVTKASWLVEVVSSRVNERRSRKVVQEGEVENREG